jgi:hypothetical protein
MSSVLEYLRHVPLPDRSHNMMSLQWWIEYLLKTYEEDPYHVRRCAAAAHAPVCVSGRAALRGCALSARG